MGNSQSAGCEAVSRHFSGLGDHVQLKFDESQEVEAQLPTPISPMYEKGENENEWVCTNQDKVDQRADERNALRRPIIAALGDDMLNACLASSLSYEADPMEALRGRQRASLYHGLTFVRAGSNLQPQQYIVAANADQSVYYFAFRGTQDMADVLADANVVASAQMEGGKCHRGFAKRAESMPLRAIATLLEQNKRVVLTGHSLGGAVACLATSILLRREVLQKDKHDLIKCITFAQPLVADQDFARTITSSKMGKHFHMVVAEEDPVPLALQLFQCSVTHNEDFRKKIAEMWDGVWDFGLALAPGSTAVKAVSKALASHMVDLIKGAIERGAQNTLLPPAFPFGYVYVINKCDNKMDMLPPGRVPNILSPRDGSLEVLEVNLQRHRIQLYLAAVSRFPNNFRQAAPSQLASESELSSFLTPSVDHESIKTVRSYTSMTVVLHGTNLDLIERIRVDGADVSSRDGAFTFTMTTWKDDDGEKMRSELPLGALDKDKPVILVSSLVHSERPVALPHPKRDSSMNEAPTEEELHLLARFAGKSVANCYLALFRRAMLLCSSYGTLARDHNDPLSGLSEAQRDWLEEVKTKLDAMAQLARLDRLADSPLEEIEVLRDSLGGLPMEEHGREVYNFAFELCSALEVKEVAAALAGAALTREMVDNINDWFKYSGKKMIKVGKVMPMWEGIATGCVGRCLVNLFPKGSPFLPSVIMSSLLDGTLELDDALRMADVACAAVLATMNSRELPIALNSSSLARNLAGTFMGLGIFVGGVAFGASPVAGAGVVGHIWGAIGHGERFSDALRDGCRFFDPRLYINGCAYLAAKTTDKEAACWQSFLSLALELLGGDSAGDAFGNQFKLADIMQNFVLHEYGDMVKMSKTRSLQNLTDGLNKISEDAVGFGLTTTTARASFWNKMRLAALNHSLWKLLAAHYSIGVIGTARLGKSTLVAELSGKDTAAGEGRSCHTHTIHTYENKDAPGINIMDFPGVDDLGALEGLFARGSSAVDMLVILADGPKAHVRETINLLKAVAKLKGMNKPRVLLCMHRADEWLITRHGGDLAAFRASVEEQKRDITNLLIQKAAFPDFLTCHPTCFKLSPMLTTADIVASLNKAGVLDICRVIKWMADNAPACWGRHIRNIAPMTKSWAEFVPTVAPPGERLAACERELGLTSGGLTLMQRLEAIEGMLFGAARSGAFLDRLPAAESAAGL